jgi:histidinol phosphatase-like enzyme
MKKIIFLDIDGVLATNKEFFRNTSKFWENHPAMAELKVPYPWNEGCVKIFNDILD